jgi:hypothetical protein
MGETTSTFSLCTLWWVEALAGHGTTTRGPGAVRALPGLRGTPTVCSPKIWNRLADSSWATFSRSTHTGIISAWLALGAPPPTH